MKLRIIFAVALLFICLVVLVIGISERSFLPKTVLKINELPKGVKVLEKNDNTSIGSQSYVNFWVLKVPGSSVEVLLSGRQYSNCKKSRNNGTKAYGILKNTSNFLYSECYEYSDNNVAAVIYVNSTEKTALVEYITN